MPFNLDIIPLSRRGSLLALGHPVLVNGKLVGADGHARGGGGARDGVYLRNLHGGVFPQEAFRFDVLRGRTVVQARECAEPSGLTLSARGGRVEAVFSDTRRLRVRGTGLGLRLTFVPTGPFECAHALDEKRWRINSFAQRGEFQVSSLSGTIRVSAPWDGRLRCTRIVIEFAPVKPGGTWEATIEELIAPARPVHLPRTFAAERALVADDFARFHAHMPTVPKPLGEARALASYLLWSNVVEPQGHLTRQAVYMSKRHMAKLWSWDNCFNAMALASGHPQLAWDQMMTLVDHQHPSGAFFDSIEDREIIRNFVKPPIHGWALAHLMRRTRFVDRARLREIYQPLCRWTDWWMRERDDDGDGLPQYNHGNDSGWDNGTLFSVGIPVEGPDLAAFLVIQMDVLADIATRLGHRRDAERWNARAEKLLKRLLAHSWRDDHFVAPRSGDHTLATQGDSLMTFLPLVLGKRLPVAVRRAMIAGLTRRGRFITRWGVATESPKSPLYEPDGYWRGPIWAPSTMLIVDGLRVCGEVDVARDLAARFCGMCAKHGFAENFDALTGRGLRDLSYTWTASVFLLLAHDYLR